MKERLTNARLAKLHGHRVSFGQGGPGDGIVAIGLLMGFDQSTVTVSEKGVRRVELRKEIGAWTDLDDPANEKLDATLRKAGYNDDPID